MKKFLLIPDSFKGTMSSAEICGLMETAIRPYYPEAEIVSIPVADGGEGSVDSFLAAMGGRRVNLTVKGPYMEEVPAFYGLTGGGRIAVIEMAACAGLPLAGEDRHPEKTTTYGVGQLMGDALKRGCAKIVMCLGGSATNDLGAGAAAAMGVRFLDEEGNAFIPVGENLAKIARIDMRGLPAALADVEIATMCDIDNPLCGENGAAYVFAPQKGANPDMTAYLDGQLRAAAEVIRTSLGIDVSEMPGAGAAGGMGGGMAAFFGSRLQMGIETVLDTVGFERLLEGADMVLTGEGKIDIQSLRGKVVIGVARRAKKKKVPVIAIVGDIGDGIEDAYGEGLSAIFSINRVALPFQEAKLRSKCDLYLTVDNLMRFLSASGVRPKRSA